ncbi:hypothetical protein AB0G77_08375 [Streptomyces hygroscopicus]|uniref:hypothetical protein n=1 Tax=Streptomyces hygroscopicus TaxID=1912 RepID=UPI0033F3EADF
MTHTLPAPRTRPAPARVPGDAAGRVPPAAAAPAVFPAALRAGRPVRPAPGPGPARAGSAVPARRGGPPLPVGPTAGGAAEEPTAPVALAYAVRMIVGLLVPTAGGHFVGGRGSARHLFGEHGSAGHFVGERGSARHLFGEHGPAGRAAECRAA